MRLTGLLGPSTRGGAVEARRAHNPEVVGSNPTPATNILVSARCCTLAARLMDTLTSEERSERMSLVRGRDTKPEMLVRRLVHGLGYRYRLHRGDLPGRPDMVFPSRHRAIFVHGCFWHRHPQCKLARIPKSRQEFWVPKLEGNRRRDLENQRRLREIGWDLLVIWECETRDRQSMTDRIKSFLGNKCQPEVS